MDLLKVGSALLVGLLTLASGLCDAQGFVHAARIWEGGSLHWGAVGRSALGFASGISIYYVILRQLDAAGVRAPEVQTLMWFSVTMIGVAVFSGAFGTWRRIDQGVAVAVLVGIAWLMVRTGEP